MKNVKFLTYKPECCLASVYYCSIDDHAEVFILVNFDVDELFHLIFVQE